MFEFDAAWQALTLIAEPERLAWLFFGCVVGFTVGIIPGLGGVIGMSILLPFVFGMDPYSATALLIGMMAVVSVSDSFPSVLIGIPGSAGSQATIMDGYPLSQQGQSARALGATFFGALAGGAFGAVFLFVTISIAAPLVLLAGSPELFALTVLGLSLVGILTRGAPLAGLLVGVLGLFIGTLGLSPGAGTLRYTFGWLYLFDGIPLAVFALGLFGIPEMIDLLITGESISKTSVVAKGRMQGVRDVIQHRWLVLRSSLLGSLLGVIPGVGGSVVDWITYGVAKQSARDSSMFGKGDIRGVIAPEAGNSAKEGGALLPTLLFSIPGSATSAMLLGGLTLLGLQTGPSMVTDNLDVTFSVVWSLALANFIGAAMCFLASPYVSRITAIPAKKFMPFLLVLMAIASYQSTRHWGDITLLLGIGIVAWVMKQIGWPRAPMLIGFVLALPSERYLHLSMSLYGFEWLKRPGVIGIFVVTFLLLIMGILRSKPSAPAEAETVTTGGGKS